MKNIKMIFRDVKNEAKKQGYKEAARKYESIFKSLESAYFQMKEYLDSTGDAGDIRLEELISTLEFLEKEREELKRQVQINAKKISLQYNISENLIMSELVNRTLLLGASNSADYNPNFIFGSGTPMESGEPKATEIPYFKIGWRNLLHRKENQFFIEEVKAYEEARGIYEKKIAELKEKLDELTTKGKADIRESFSLINQVLYDIARIEQQIIELEIILSDGGSYE